MKLIMKIALVVFFVCSAITAQTVVPKNKIHPAIPSDGISGHFFSVMVYFDPTANSYYYYNPTTPNPNVAAIKLSVDTVNIKLNSVIVKLIQMFDRMEKDTTNLNYLSKLTDVLNAIKADSTTLYAKLVKGDYKSVTTGTDSLTLASLGYKNWIDGDIYSSDTLKYSFDRAFTAGNVGYAFPGILTPIGKTEIKDNPKLYFKRYSSSGTVNYAYKLRGW